MKEQAERDSKYNCVWTKSFCFFARVSSEFSSWHKKYWSCFISVCERCPCADYSEWQWFWMALLFVIRSSSRNRQRRTIGLIAGTERRMQWYQQIVYLWKVPWNPLWACGVGPCGLAGRRVMVGGVWRFAGLSWNILGACTHILAFWGRFKHSGRSPRSRFARRWQQIRLDMNDLFYILCFWLVALQSFQLWQGAKLAIGDEFHQMEIEKMYTINHFVDSCICLYDGAQRIVFFNYGDRLADEAKNDDNSEEFWNWQRSVTGGASLSVHAACAPELIVTMPYCWCFSGKLVKFLNKTSVQYGQKNCQILFPLDHADEFTLSALTRIHYSFFWSCFLLLWSLQSWKWFSIWETLGFLIF